MSRHNYSKDKQSAIKTVCIILSIVLLFGVAGGIVFIKTYHNYVKTVISPTCTQRGYTQYVCSICHDIYRENYLNPLGHNFGDWKATTNPTAFSYGVENRECTRCGETQQRYVEPTTKMARIYLDGNVTISSSDLEAGCKFTYKNGDEVITSYAELTLQDVATHDDDKLDYTINLYKDSSNEDDNKIKIGSWDKSSIFNLNGDFYDYSKARNLSASDLYSQVEQASDNLDSNIAKSPNNGATEGFAVVVFMNKNFSGIYNLIMPKTEMLFSHGKTKPKAVICSNIFNDVTQFKALTQGQGTDWEVVYSKDDKKAWAYESFNKLISYIKDNDGDALTSKLDKYLDVDATIDYMLTMYTTASGANTARNMIFVTYDGVRWIPSMYDLDMTFGLDSKGNTSTLMTTLIPKFNKDGSIYTDTSSLLWQRIMDNYYSESSSRYNQLRANVYTKSNIQTIFEKYTSKITDDMYKAEIDRFSGTPSKDVIPTKQLDEFLDLRFEILDDFFE